MGIFMRKFKKQEWMILGLEAALALLLIFGYKNTAAQKVDTWSGHVESGADEKEKGIKEGKKKGEEKEEEEEMLQEKKIAITFDDGPHPVYTEKLLDGLKDRISKQPFLYLGKRRRNIRKL